MNPVLPNAVRVDGEIIALVWGEGAITPTIEGILIRPSKVSAFEIECCRCKSWLARRCLTYKLMTEIYTCMSCKNTGEGNSFFGRKHSDEFKDRLSSERKGTWA